jgi:hypothetical protein
VVGVVNLWGFGQKAFIERSKSIHLGLPGNDQKTAKIGPKNGENRSPEWSKSLADLAGRPAGQAAGWLAGLHLLGHVGSASWRHVKTLLRNGFSGCFSLVLFQGGWELVRFLFRWPAKLARNCFFYCFGLLCCV